MKQMTLPRPLICISIFSILSVGLVYRTGCVSTKYTPPTFCDRAVASRSCANPPTFDSLNIEAYLGRWYEIGSSANFKLTREAGSVCDQAQYSSASGKLTLVNSSLKVIGFPGMTALRSLTSATSSVCNGVREICSELAQSSIINKALKHISKATEYLRGRHKTEYALLSRTSKNLISSIELTETALESIADDVNQVQQSGGNVSQVNAPLQDSVFAIERYSTRASKEQAVINVLVGDIHNAGSQLTSIMKKLEESEANVRNELARAVSLLVEAADNVAGSSSAIARSLREITEGASTLGKGGQPLKNGFVSFRDGTLFQNTSSPGKLAVDVQGAKGPIWVLDVEEDGEGGYTAALIYSCTELNPGRLDRTIFTLSRKPQLDKRIVDRFLKLARSYGVYNDCENPFLFSIQRGGNCGRPANI